MDEIPWSKPNLEWYFYPAPPLLGKQAQTKQPSPLGADGNSQGTLQKLAGDSHTKAQ